MLIPICFIAFFLFFFISLIVWLFRSRNGRRDGRDGDQEGLFRFPPRRGRRTTPIPSDTKEHPTQHGTRTSTDQRALEQFQREREVRLEKIVRELDPEKRAALERIYCWQCGAPLSIYDHRCGKCDQTLR